MDLDGFIYKKLVNFEYLKVNEMVFRKGKTRLTVLLVVSLLFFLTDCKMVINRYYGIRKPKVETGESLCKYLKKKNINDNNIYTIDIKDLPEIFKAIQSSVPEIMLFDARSKKLVKYKEDTTTCNAGAFNFIEEISKDMNLQYVDSITLDDYLPMLRDFMGNPVKIEMTDNMDYYLFIYWVRYSGRLNKNHVKMWEEEANNNSKSRIRVFKVNLDEQAWWKNGG